jgi:hypothetical protein
LNISVGDTKLNIYVTTDEGQNLPSDGNSLKDFQIDASGGGEQTGKIQLNKDLKGINSIGGSSSWDFINFGEFFF